MTIRCAASARLAVLGVKRASEVSGLHVSDGKVDEADGVVELKVRRQKNDQLGAGQMARVIALPAWGGACPVHLVSEWLWLRSWLARYHNYTGRMPASADEGPLLVGLSRARFGLGLASSGATASWREGFDGRSLSPRKGGARFYVVNGMSREATQELAGWKSPAVVEGVYTKARSEEVVPEMRAAVAKACAGLEVERFARDLDRDVCAQGSEALGAERGAEARIWRRRFRSVRELLAPSVVLPIMEDFWLLAGRRVRALKFPTRQIRKVLPWGSSFRPERKRYRSADPHNVVRTRKREAAVSSAPDKRTRRG